MGRWSVPGAADGCAQFRGGLIGSRGGLIGSRGGTIGRTGGCLGPFMRRLTPQVVAQAGRPHCHLSGPAAQERVKATSKRAHAHTSLPPLRGQRAGTTGNASPHQKAKKSPFQQHAVSNNPITRLGCDSCSIGQHKTPNPKGRGFAGRDFSVPPTSGLLRGSVSSGFAVII